MLNLSWGQFIGISVKMMTADESHPIWTQARQAAANWRALKGIYDGDMKEGIFIAGQVVGACDDLPTAQVLVDRIMTEAEAFIDKANAMRK
jgi:NAD(P)H-dependent flavin oxidoreductase YrpB (nitropropane dioxygenase family)